jgi:hypothetical protein
MRLGLGQRRSWKGYNGLSYDRFGGAYAGCRVGVRLKWKNCFLKNNITGYIKTARFYIETFITFMMKIVT